MTPIKKVAIITNIPNPYRIPLFNEINRQLNKVNCELNVLFGALTYARRSWKVDMGECKFNYEILPSKKMSGKNPEKIVFTYSKLLTRLSAINPSVIIVIGFSPATIKLLFRSMIRKTRFIIWSGAVHRKNRPDSLLRKIQRRLLIKRASGFIAYGTKAKEYLMSLGAPGKKIWIGINTVDTKFYYEQTKRIRSELEPRNGTKRLLYIGYITQGKRLDLLVQAVKVLLNSGADITLDIVGDGPHLPEIKKLCSELVVDDNVNICGYKQKDELPVYLAQADCFLFPSEYDVWGLVLVEAMVSGLPCISSIYSGATHDLIQHGTTGFALDFENIEAVVNQINWVLKHPQESQTIGENASRFIREKVNLKKSAEGFVQAIQSI